MKYPFRIFKAQEGGEVFWAAESSALKGCVGEGSTPEEAIKSLEESETFWIQVAGDSGISIPEIPVEELQTYSGKFTIRVSSFVHREAAELAKKDGISLNQYVNDAIVSQNSRRASIRYIERELRDTVLSIKALLQDVTATASQGITVYNVGKPSYLHVAGKTSLA